MIQTLTNAFLTLFWRLISLLFIIVPLVLLFLPPILVAKSKRMSVRIISLTFFLALILSVSAFIFLEHKYNPQSTIAIYYIPLFDERDKDVNLLYTNCKHLGKTDYINGRKQTEKFKCAEILHESFIQFCTARAYTDRCFWRKSFLLIDKVLGGNLMHTNKGDCAALQKNTTLDPEYLSTEQVIYQEGCNDYYYLKYTPIKTGTTTIKSIMGGYENDLDIMIK